MIGGGPAGLAAAIALRLAGASVILFEASQPPVDKACGEGLMPNTGAALSELGVRIGANEGYPFRGIRFVDRGVNAAAGFRGSNGLGVRRTLLHRALADRAAAVGVELCWNAKGVEIVDAGVLFRSRLFRPVLIVGADGLHSRVRRKHEMDQEPSSLRYGFRRHFAIAPWSDYVEIYCHRQRQIYITPVSSQQIGVALLTANPHERLADVLPLFPNLSERLRLANMISSERGSPTVMRTLKRVTKPGLALVGDASGSVDAITGEGIGLAVEQAIALGHAFRVGDLEMYERAHRHILAPSRLLGRTLLALSKSDSVQTAALRVAARCPMLCDAILAAYVRRRSSINETAGMESTTVSLPNPERLNSQS